MQGLRGGNPRSEKQFVCAVGESVRETDGDAGPAPAFWLAPVDVVSAYGYGWHNERRSPAAECLRVWQRPLELGWWGPADGTRRR
jgi:hypothetical protein